MKKTDFIAIVAALALAGCRSSCSRAVYDAADPVIGSWGLQLPYDGMCAGHVKFYRDADGNAQATVLWRWAHPIGVENVKIERNGFSFSHPWGFDVKGHVDGMKLAAEVFNRGGDNDGKKAGDIKGWRNPPACTKISTSDARFGAPIDLLENGLDGWKNMNPNAKFGWKIVEEDGEKVLMNALGKDANGKWSGGGANIQTLREDFFDFNLAFDVRIPAKSNSGVYLRGRYEIQMVDSFGKTPGKHDMCALYGRIAPAAGAEKAPGEWQHVDVTLYKRHLTVKLNGKTVIDNAIVEGVTGGAIDAREFVPGPIYLQGDHSDADFKNMILRPAVD